MQACTGLKSPREEICFKRLFKNVGKMFTTKCQLAMQWYSAPKTLPSSTSLEVFSKSVEVVLNSNPQNVIFLGPRGFRTSGIWNGPFVHSLLSEALKVARGTFEGCTCLPTCWISLKTSFHLRQGALLDLYKPPWHPSPWPGEERIHSACGAAEERSGPGCRL